MSRRKILLIIVIVVIVLAVAGVVATFLGIDLFATVSGEASKQPDSYSSVDALKSGKAYVWHHDGGDIEKDLKKGADESIFFTCITGDYNFKNEELGEEIEYPRSIWVSSDTDNRIPTVTYKDKLIYVSSTEVPQEIVFERFADYGYSIGISNMEADMGGHYYITFADVDDDDYKYFIDLNSDASQLTELTAITRLYLDKVGDVKVDEEHVSDGGTVMGLKKDKAYTCEFYTGTYYQDFNLTANIHCFGSMERFINYDYEFMHSNFIVIDIPEYFKSGYYFVNGVGLFRYVSDGDAGKYNGKSYDAAIDWNDPIILYDEDGVVIYDPSDPDFEEKQQEQKAQEIEEKSDKGDESIDDGNE
ncbi:hypothetical protein SAMN02910400_01045 [Lachnospiraceae bacterium C10]|nr:hypothetical protein SAMN02910400_01045 [Lachnospiraceae bacterium C10]